MKKEGAFFIKSLFHSLYFFSWMSKGVQPLLVVLRQVSSDSVPFFYSNSIYTEYCRTGGWCFNFCLHPPCACNMTVLLQAISSDRKHAQSLTDFRRGCLCEVSSHVGGRKIEDQTYTLYFSHTLFFLQRLQ